MRQQQVMVFLPYVEYLICTLPLANRWRSFSLAARHYRVCFDPGDLCIPLGSPLVAAVSLRQVAWPATRRESYRCWRLVLFHTRVVTYPC